MSRTVRGRPDHIIVFARYPAPGRTKTRLIPVLGRLGAADLCRRLTEKTLATARCAAEKRRAGLEVCHDGGGLKRMRRWLGRDLLFTAQVEGGLGERMEAAMDRAFADGCGLVLLLGTDIPDVEPAHLGKAFEHLEDHDLVLGPSLDGGYWLIGLKRRADVFGGIVWGRADVLEKTLAKAREKSLSVRLLAPLSDVDTLDDLAAWRPEEAATRPYLSVVIPALNEAGRVARTIDSARDPEAEILVVNGGSRDDTAGEAARAGAKVLSASRGRARQQNLGASAARGAVLLFLHADTRLPAGYAGLIFEALLDPGVMLGAFSFKTDLAGGAGRGIEALVNFRSKILRLPYGDQGLFLRKTVFASAGGFPDTPLAEDFLLVRRLKKQGRIVTLAAPAVTSGRRWQNLGLLRTTLVNQIVLAGLYAGLKPATLARFHQRPGLGSRWQGRA